MAERLQLPAEALARLPSMPSLNDVVCAYLLSGGSRNTNTVYTRLQRVIRDECPPPGSVLKDLASIPAFNLYLTTTFDPLLEYALNAERFGGQPLTQVCSFSPKEAADLPSRKRDLTKVTLYYILGRVSPDPSYAVWEEDVLEFVVALHRHMPEMGKLSFDLSDHGLLVLGLNFSDWLVRFFLRIAKQSRLSEIRTQTHYLAEGPRSALPQSMVLFFGGLGGNIHIVDADPIAFAAKLAAEWREKHPPTPGRTDTRFTLPPEQEMPAGSIFISYAREDKEATRRLKAGLERYGCLVWYDGERLKPGAHWQNELNDEVTKRCALFLSVVSRTTEATEEAYYHLERNWAAQRAAKFSGGGEFYIPVVVDDSPLAAAREPRILGSAGSVQATRLPGGEVTPEFGDYMRALQERRRGAPSTS